MEHDIELHIMHQAIFGEDLKEIKDPDEVLGMLKNGETDIITNLKWGEKRGEEVHDIHKIVLLKIEEKRVIFFNPLAHPENMEKGTVIDGEETGPKRTIEGVGLESVSIDEFINFFKERDAVSYIPASKE